MYKRRYAYPPALEDAAPPVFVVWIRSWHFKPGHIPGSITYFLFYVILSTDLVVVFTKWSLCRKLCHHNS